YINLAPYGIFVLGADGNFQDANVAMQELTGFCDSEMDLEEGVDKTETEKISQLRAQISNALNKGKDYFEIKLTCKNNSVKHCSVFGVVLGGATRRPTMPVPLTKMWPP
ncbi:MAG: PAS domain-containing protein, partial [Desulfobacterales bacterium]